MVRSLPLWLAVLLLAGCQADVAPEPPRAVDRATPEPAPAYDASLEPAAAVLSLVPQSADTVTVTDWDGVRAQLGQPDLTSEDLMTDRLAFWERVRDEAAVLTEGLLLEETSRLELGYGFTQDDVDWEARWTGADGPGFALALRPDLDLRGVRRAAEDGVAPLTGATLLPGRHLVVAGTAETDVWANEPLWEELVGEPATATYLHRGCIPLYRALGPDAGAEDVDEVLASHPLTTLEELAGFAVAFGDHQAVVRTEPDRGDLFERMRLGESWPGSGFAGTFANGAADPGTGRIGFTVTDPPAAAALTLGEELPFGVCNEAVPLPAPTGL